MTDFEIIERSRLSCPGLRTFCKIADFWKLDETQRTAALGAPDHSTYNEWISKARAEQAVTLSRDTLLRVSAMLGIHKALSYLFSDHPEALAWLKSPHCGASFGGDSPMNLVVHGAQDDLMTVRRYLEAWLQGQVTPGIPEGSFTPVTEKDVVFEGSAK
ncbi:DUF2384 domain-containing protein [Sulfitobacter sp. Ks41]|uniref:antitoxin Xre/MbcA/ParS toxin-binding domain-containing protein n=1 Tax=Sulfitobacter sp. Ks41 TaxID=2731139 RepID=UPI0023E19508|nr:antitoxin Xre/MbcA/ParS toxin-binding domain-containing protein [Sulfitobacter sp. Ks41]MDF3361942.1 DUF2384 domain-containing protein [Sulfitobacter sp. Ks41]